METVKRLTREVRIQAKYERSLDVLRYLKEQGIKENKIWYHVGLGETEEEVIETLHDLAAAKVDIITIVNTQPSKSIYQLKRIITPEQFKNTKNW